MASEILYRYRRGINDPKSQHRHRLRSLGRVSEACYVLRFIFQETTIQRLPTAVLHPRRSAQEQARTLSLAGDYAAS